MAGKRISLLTFCAALLMILGSTIGCSAAMIRDGDPGTIGEALTKADGVTVTLPAEQVMWRGRSGKSFAIKEWFEKLPDQPRLIVVSTRPLPVDQYWTVDVTGTLGTFPETTDDGNVAGQRVLIVSPENVTVYCDPKGRPFMFLPIKGHEQNWRDKCPLPALAGTPTVAACQL